MNNKSAIWIKARIYNIVIRYIKKELTPSLIRYTLEQIVCDILLHIEECNIISKSEIVDFILKTAQNACPEVKLVSEDKKKFTKAGHAQFLCCCIIYILQNRHNYI